MEEGSLATAEVGHSEVRDTSLWGVDRVPLVVQTIDLDVTTLKINFKRGQVKIYEKRVDLLNVQYVSHMI